MAYQNYAYVKLEHICENIINLLRQPICSNFLTNGKCVTELPLCISLLAMCSDNCELIHSGASGAVHIFKV